MPILPKALLALSTLLLTHSCYSAHEHSSTFASTVSLPTDIVLETLLAVSLLCIGIVMSVSGSEKSALRPILHRVWCGKLERERGRGPYAFLDERPSFWDVRGARNEFAEFMKNAGEKPEDVGKSG